jgi:DNA-binding FadR family transcriptional regulator
MSLPNGVVVNRLARGALADQIVEQMTEWILSGKFGAGDHLPPEHVLAEQFGVSKTAVREAAKVLASKGLLTIRQGIGTVVTSRERWNVLDPHILLYTRGTATLSDLLQARRMVEPDIAALAAEKRDDAVLRRLRESIEEGDRVTNVDEHVHWDMSFHQTLADATGNPVLVILMNSIGQLLRASRAALFNVRGSVGRANAYHRQICEAVAAGDADGARYAMLEHLQQVADDFEMLVKDATP